MKKKLNTTLFFVLILIFVFQSGCYLNAKIEGLDSKETLGSSSPLLLTANTYNLNLQETDSDIVYTDLELILSKPADEDMAISLQTTDGYASNTIDYKITSQVILPKGKSSVVIPITIVGDVVGEGDENFTIAFSSSKAGLQIPNSVIQVNIIENDPISLTVTALYPSNGSNFFDMVQNQKTTPLPLVADTVCNYTGSQAYDVCLDGGYFKKVAAIGRHSCINLTLEDNLGVFDWKCDSSTDPVFFYSSGIKPGKGLKDLLNASSFKNNFVTLKYSGNNVATSNSLIWWTNPVTPIALNSGGADARITLSGQGTFYTVVNSGLSRGISIASAKVGLVILTGAILTATSSLDGDCDAAVVGTQICLIDIKQGADLAYIEGDFLGTSSLESVIAFNTLMGTAYMVRMHNLNIVGVGVNSGINTQTTNHKGLSITAAKISNFAIALYFSHHGGSKLIKDVVLYNNQSPIFEAGLGWNTYYVNFKLINNSSGAFITSVWYAFMQNIQSINNISADGLYVSGNYSVAKNILSVGNSVGINLAAPNSVVNGATSIGNSAEGLLYSTSATTFVGTSDVLSANNLTGLRIDKGSKFNNLSLTDNNSGVEFRSAATGSNFGEKLLLGNTTDCLYTSAGASPGLTGINCDNEGPSTANKTLGVSANNYFKGVVTSDLINVHSTGSAIANAITDWFNFSSPFRLWANESLSSLISSPRNACSGTNPCRIWDIRLNANNMYVHNANGLFINQAPCPSSIQGDVTDNYYFTYHLRHATEIFGDRVGNDNGLCESGEECIYSPNIGYYQGEGDYTQNTCVFQNGVTSNAVTNVKMYAYPQ